MANVLTIIGIVNIFYKIKMHDTMIKNQVYRSKVVGFKYFSSQYIFYWGDFLGWKLSKIYLEKKRCV